MQLVLISMHNNYCPMYIHAALIQATSDQQVPSL